MKIKIDFSINLIVFREEHTLFFFFNLNIERKEENERVKKTKKSRVN